MSSARLPLTSKADLWRGSDAQHTRTVYLLYTELDVHLSLSELDIRLTLTLHSHSSRVQTLVRVTQRAESRERSAVAEAAQMNERSGPKRVAISARRVPRDIVVGAIGGGLRLLACLSALTRNSLQPTGARAIFGWACDWRGERSAGHRVEVDIPVMIAGGAGKQSRIIS